MLSNFKEKNIYCCIDSDLDGICSRLVAESYIEPISKNFFITNTAQRDMSEFEEDKADKAEIIIFTDITPTVELYEDLIKRGKEVYIFDHHLSGYELLKDIVDKNYYYTDEKCGCKILFESLTENTRPNRVLYQIVELCNCYDLFHTKSTMWQDAKSFNNILYGYVNWSQSLCDTERNLTFLTNMKYKMEHHKHFSFSDYERRLIQNAERKEKSNYKKAKDSLQERVDGEGNTYLYAELVSKLSIVANRFLDEYGRRIKYVAIHSTYKENAKEEKKVSLRSGKNFDVSKIAEKYGGGGHSQASGLLLSKDDFISFKQGKKHLI